MDTKTTKTTKGTKALGSPSQPAAGRLPPRRDRLGFARLVVFVPLVVFVSKDLGALGVLAV
ncbi:MAG: hypothetical protein JSR98_17355 [Proteobacteria bacterium]|nr:hypothetical protein [Pseudomonadota bacterium]